MELKFGVFEALENMHSGAQIDRSLFLAELNKVGINAFCNFLLDFGVDIEIDSGPLTDGILITLGKVILEIVSMSFLAAWATFD